MNKRMMILILIFLGLLVSGCQADGTNRASVLEESPWTLVDLDGTAPLDQKRPTLNFEAGQISGNTGCNQYGGEFQVEDGAIQIEDLYSTEMACFEPAGVMEQEQMYLELLRSIDRFEIVDDHLVVLTKDSRHLTFTSNPGDIQPSTTQIMPNTQTPVSEANTPTVTPTVKMLEGFNEYRDEAAGIVVQIPEGWVVTGIIEGESAILQSYPEDKYVGGEPREEGDTKCDLSIRPHSDTAEGLFEQWQSDSMTTIVSEDTFQLLSGKSAKRLIVDSRGRATVFMTEISERVILLTCFGDFENVDVIASTLHATE